MITMTDTICGFLKNGRFLCPDCAPEHWWDARVYRSNITPYSQQCFQCKQIIVDGLKRADGSGRPLNLFDLPVQIEGEGYEWVAHVTIHAGPDQSHNILDKINQVLTEAGINGGCESVSRKDF